MTKDYYNILGISEFDSAENIKNAYRRLVRKYHPDVAGNTQENILRFKEITEAYEVLSNNLKKSEYDKAKRFYDYAKKEHTDYKDNSKNFHSEGLNKSSKFNWESFLGKKYRETVFKQKEQQNPKKGEDVYTDIEITFYEALSGTNKTINMLQTHICPSCKGRKFVNGTKCSICNGKGEFSDYKKFNVKIPAGIKDNSKIRLAGEGARGVNGGKNGDLYIIVHVKSDINYEIDGLNIYKKIAITPFEAVLGGNIRIKTAEKTLSIKLAPNTQNGQKIRLSGCGIVQNNKIGDMIVSVEIKIPSKLSDEEIKLYKKLAEISTSDIRQVEEL